MSEALEKIDRGALAALMSPEEIEGFNKGFGVGIGGDFLPSLSIRGKKFRAKIEGEETDLPTELPVVFIAARQCVSKVFYDGPYNPKENKPPDCSSTDGQYPDINITDPVSPICQTCDNNAWGSRGNGSKGKACDDYQQIVVMIEGVDQAFGLRLKPSSWGPYKAHVKQLDMAGIPLIAARTVLTIVGDEFPIVNFKYDGLVERATFAQAKEWIEKAEVQTLVQIQSRANQPSSGQNSATQSAQQPVVVERSEQEAIATGSENPEPPKKSLAELLGKSEAKPKATRKKKTVEDVIEESTAEPVSEPGAIATGQNEQTTEAAAKLNALLAKMKG